ncbi:hypothetical protein [Microbulbifer magnicolonia]|uniref:hypothetical protein n=1 Tax=Microbulbifer magnicolonia TaxID=3109744 RepID=UPI002B40E582|nr:hypothetical protein [Microbulbifer sp. GG15]
MTDVEKIKENLDYVSSAVRAGDSHGGIPALYFMWGALIAIGFALPDLAPQLAAPYWLIAGIGGGLFSWWWGARNARRQGVNDTALGRRYGLHWTIAGVAFLLCFLPLAAGRLPAETGATNFLLAAGLAYALAGVHLERPLLYSGLLMLAAYGVLVLLSPPYAWTLTGLVAGAGLVWAGLGRRAALRGGSVR